MNEKLRGIREKAQMTQTQVAEKAQISLRQYIRIEFGEHEPNVCTAIRIADVLGVENLRLLWGDNKNDV